MAERQIVIQVPVKNRRDLITKYLKVLYQFHRLPDKELSLLVELIYYYLKFFYKYNDEELAYKLLYDLDTKKEIRKNLENMKDPVFQNYLSTFRKKKIIIDKRIVKQFIPPVNNFDLVISFYGTVDKGSSKEVKST